jgi:hypothetical protein
MTDAAARSVTTSQSRGTLASGGVGAPMPSESCRHIAADRGTLAEDGEGEKVGSIGDRRKTVPSSSHSLPDQNFWEDTSGLLHTLLKSLTRRRKRFEFSTADSQSDFPRIRRWPSISYC